MGVPPPLPSKPKQFSSSGTSTFSKPAYSTGTFPGKVRPVGGHLRTAGILSSHCNTLPLPNKQESPPSAAIRPYTPDLSEATTAILQKPQTLAASSIYSMYTQQATPGKSYQVGGHGTLPRSQPRGDASQPRPLALAARCSCRWCFVVSDSCLFPCSVREASPRKHWGAALCWP